MRVIDPGDEPLRQRLAKEYLDAKRFAEAATKRADELKAALRDDVANNGMPDEKGNLWAPAGPFQLKHERRVSNSIDAQAAEEWAKENGFWDQISETVERLAEDKLMALGWERPILSPTIQKFYVPKETWAFKVIEKKSYDTEDE
jgi:hypothetical protein